MSSVEENDGNGVQHLVAPDPTPALGRHYVLPSLEAGNVAELGDYVVVLTFHDKVLPAQKGTTLPRLCSRGPPAAR